MEHRPPRVRPLGRIRRPRYGFLSPRSRSLRRQAVASAYAATRISIGTAISEWNDERERGFSMYSATASHAEFAEHLLRVHSSACDECATRRAQHQYHHGHEYVRSPSMPSATGTPAMSTSRHSSVDSQTQPSQSMQSQSAADDEHEEGGHGLGDAELVVLPGPSSTPNVTVSTPSPRQLDETCETVSTTEVECLASFSESVDDRQESMEIGDDSHDLAPSPTGSENTSCARPEQGLSASGSLSISQEGPESHRSRSASTPLKPHQFMLPSLGRHLESEVSSVSSGGGNGAGASGDILEHEWEEEDTEAHELLIETIIESGIPEEAWKLNRSTLEDEVFDVTQECGDEEEFVPPQQAEVMRPKLSTGELINDDKCIAFNSCLEVLVKKAIGKVCVKCGAELTFRLVKRGTCHIHIWQCKGTVSHKDSWSSQPMFTKMYAGNMVMSIALLLSGGNFRKSSMMSKFANLGFVSETTFYCVQRLYIHKSIKEYWEEDQSKVIGELSTNDHVIVAGDGRNDSPGFSAQYCTYSLMEQDTKAIVTLKNTDVREAPKRASTNMEKVGFIKAMDDVMDKGVQVKEVVTDAQTQIKALMKNDEKYKDIEHQIDIWHTSKNISKKLAEAAKKKGCHDIVVWIPSIRNQLWYCCKNCDGNVDKLKETWTKVIHHVCNVHEWIDTTGLTSGRCDHGPLSEEDRNKPWITPGSPAHQALKDIIFDPYLLRNLKYHTNFRHTGELESFHNHILMYCPKRISYKPTGYETRTLLAAIDYNAHRNRPYVLDEEGNVKTKLRYSKVTKHWCLVPEKEPKTYSYIPELIRRIMTARETNPVRLTTAVALAEDDPRRISERVTTVEKPSKEELERKKFTRF